MKEKANGSITPVSMPANMRLELETFHRAAALRLVTFNNLTRKETEPTKDKSNVNSGTAKGSKRASDRGGGGAVVEEERWWRRSAGGEEGGATVRRK